MTYSQDFTPWPTDLAERYRRAGYWLDRPLLDILERQVVANPDGTAIIGGAGESMSFRALDAAASLLAGRLHARGLRPGQRAVVQLPNTPDFYVAFWALQKLRVAAVFALFSHNALELDAFCDQLDADLVLASRRHKLFSDDVFATKLRAAKTGRLVLFSETDFVQGESEDLASGRAAGGDVAFYQLSGGSTATPKLIPRTHDDYYYSVRRSAEVCDLTSETVYLCALPAPHNFPLSSPGALGVWYAGGTVVIAPDPTPETCFPLIARHRVTMTSLVPPLLDLWLQAKGRGLSGLESLRLIQVGGARLGETTARRVEPELGCSLQQVFGMAEGLVCYSRLSDDAWHRENTQGVPMSEADELLILDEDGRPVEPGEPGLLWTRGPYTIRGYFRAPEHNAAVFDRLGFYKTGDIVRRLESGHLVVVGREKDQINRGGEKIAAAEVENLLLRHEGVLQAAVVAVPDASLGERSCAFLVCASEMSKPHVLRRHLRDLGIADFKLPDRFVQLEVIPLTPVGKPDKARLRRMAAEL